MNEGIRILHCVIGSMNTGGIENMLMTMYRHIDRNKIQFDFVVHDPNENVHEKEILALGGNVYRTPPISKNFLSHIRAFDLLLKSHSEYRIVHIHTTYSIMLIDALIAKANGRTVIVHSHNSSANFKRTCFHILFRGSISHIADYRIACSKEAADWMFSTNDRKKVLLWPNAIEVERYKYSSEARKSVRNSRNAMGKYIIANVGRLSYQKNQNLMIEIFAEYCKIDPASELWLIGAGEDKSALEQKCIDLDIYDKVVFWGDVNAAEIGAILSASDIFVMTSRYEGLGIAAIEAQTAGLPVVLSDRIPRSMVLTTNIKYISEYNNIREWTNALGTLQNERNMAYYEVKQSDYNIEVWIKKVEEFYTSIHDQVYEDR